MIHEAWAQPPSAASTARSWCDDGASILSSSRAPPEEDVADDDGDELQVLDDEEEEEDAPMPPVEEQEPEPEPVDITPVAGSPAKVTQSAYVELMPSIFPHRPPTVFFEVPPGLPSRAERGSSAKADASVAARVRVPLDAALTRTLCMRIEKNANSVRHAFKRAGFTVNPTGHSAPPLVCWAKHQGDKLFKELPPGGLVNHFPGSWTLGRKDGLAKILNAQQQRLGSSEYNFAPRTFTLPADRYALEHALAAGTLQGNGAFIVGLTSLSESSTSLITTYPSRRR